MYTKTKFIEEGRVLKTTLEEKLGLALTSFEDETGLKITDVSLSRHVKIGAPDRVLVQITVTL